MQAELTRPKEGSPIRLVSTRFGAIEIPGEYIWDFPEGLIGMKAEKRFALLNSCEKKDTVFVWLHSIDHGGLALPVMNPLIAFPDFGIRQDEPDIIRLGLENTGDVHVLVIVRVPPGDPGGITANLAAPLILHPKRKLGWQIILEKGNYKVAEPLFADRQKDQSDDSENLVSVGSSSPAISVVKEQYNEDEDSLYVTGSRIKIEEVRPTNDSVS